MAPGNYVEAMLRGHLENPRVLATRFREALDDSKHMVGCGCFRRPSPVSTLDDAGTRGQRRKTERFGVVDTRAYAGGHGVI